MFRTAFIFFFVSIIAGVFGYSGIALGDASISKVLFGICFLLFVVLLTAAYHFERPVVRK